jgi:hypothetical protein
MSVNSQPDDVPVAIPNSGNCRILAFDWNTVGLKNTEMSFGPPIKVTHLDLQRRLFADD